MQIHGDAIARALAGNGKGPLTPQTIDRLRKVQAERLDSRWDAMLEDLRRRAPFRDLPAVEQDRAFLRLARLSRATPHRKRSKPQLLDLPISICGPGWRTVATLNGGFDFGSADTPQVVPANDYNPGDNITGNTTVAVTFPQSGQIGIGAAMGSWCDIVWEPTLTFGRLQGNRSSASLTTGFYVPNLPTLAPGALTASCTVSLPSPMLGLVAGDPKPGGELATLVYVCGQATLDVVACNVVDAVFGAPNPSKSASNTQELFIESGYGQEDNNVTNQFGGNWDTITYVVDPSGVSPAYYLSATISQPLPTSDYVLVTVSIEVSAWCLPAVQSIAVVDATGQNTGFPIATAPGFFEPYTNTSTDNTSFGTQPIQVSDVRVCGI